MVFISIVEIHPVINQLVFHGAVFFHALPETDKSQRENDQKSNEFPINLSQDASWKGFFCSDPRTLILVTGIRGGGGEPNLLNI